MGSLDTFYSIDVFKMNSSASRCEPFSYNCLYLKFFCLTVLYIFKIRYQVSVYLLFKDYLQIHFTLFFQTALNAPRVRGDNMLSEFNELSDPIQFGKHRNCFASYTNLKVFKSDCTTITENRKITRRSSSGKKYCTITVWHTTCLS